MVRIAIKLRKYGYPGANRQLARTIKSQVEVATPHHCVSDPFLFSMSKC